MKYGGSFTQAIEETHEVVEALKSLKSLTLKLNYLEHHPKSLLFFKSAPTLKPLFSFLTPDEQEVLYTLTALGQGEAVFSDWDHFSDPLPPLKALAGSLLPLKNTYFLIGGLAGYQWTLLTLLKHHADSKDPSSSLPSAMYRQPEGIALDKEKEAAARFVQAGILALPEFAEVYPVGGAADRLNLHDESGLHPLPQACLKLQGVTLLEGIIRDVIARERLYYRLTGKETITPIILMTSPEKDNRKHIEAILKEKYWFWRPKELFFLFDQPLVPMISETGRFATKSPLVLNLKPGGHGILWQLMKSHHVFSWLHNLKRDKLLIRQINNPLAGTDTNLLALAGKGALEKKSFGFLSCPRKVGAAEGMNVIVDTKEEKGSYSTLTNVEYTDFTEKGLKDEPDAPGSPYSAFPANTNILFAHLPALEKALGKLPLPGLLVNLKGQVTFYDSKGKRVHSKGGRLETTMQNIADALGSRSKNGGVAAEELETFILFNEREKTLSATKKKWQPGDSLDETPEGVFCVKQKNLRRLFTEQLGYQVPEFQGHESPSFLIDVHPALGPLWDIIRQKVQKGILIKGADLLLHVERLFLQNLTLDGALSITSLSLNGTAYLQNVTIKNRGIDWEEPHCFWKGKYKHKERLEIILHGTGEFIAKDVELEGPMTFEVPDGFRMTVTSVKGKVQTSLERAAIPSWKWAYHFDTKGFVLLTFKDQSGTVSS
jgi:hypothetical protein